MSSKFIEHSPESEGDKSLILIMDEDGNVTADPSHFEKLLNAKQIPEMGIKIVRLNSNHEEDDSEDENDEKPELKLTVEEIYPDSLSLASNDTSNSLMSSSLEILPGTSNEHVNHDLADPFSQMDPEQLQRLEHALASEQAKQILGENVAAMLDMLSVNESSATFLQNSIKNDHCYTNLLPSSDPNGPSFFVGDVRSNSSDAARGKTKMKLEQPIKGRKIIQTHVTNIINSPIKRQIIKEVPLPSKQHQIKDTRNDFGLPRIKSPPENDPTYEEEVDIEDTDSDESAEVEEDDNLSDEDYSDRTKKGKRKAKKNRKNIGKRSSLGRPPGRPAGKPGRRMTKRSRAFQEIRIQNDKLSDEMTKVMHSLDYASKSDEEKTDSSRSSRKILKKKRNKDGILTEERKDLSESRPMSGDLIKSHSAKYPKRENRKPPAHLAEAYGPALFSTPDIIRRISTAEETPQTPSSEKKNFTVGLQKSSVTAVQTDGKILHKQIEINRANRFKKPDNVLKEPLNHVKSQSQIKKVPVEIVKSGTTSLKPVKPNVSVERVEDKCKIQIPITTERAVIIKKSNPEIQKLIEKHQNSPVKSIYEDDHDYSDENIEENYYLDPTQMDQSLLESFGQQNCKSEDQLLQEAILLQEQFIGSNKNSDFETMPSDKSQAIVNFDDTFTDVVAEDTSDGFVAGEEMDNIQGDIASVMMLGSEEKIQLNKNEKNFKSDQNLMKTKKFTSEETSLRKIIIRESNEKRLTKLIESQPEAEDSVRIESPLEGNLIVDESKQEDRKRNSTKRRRSDEVSDLDSDLDDALSEASWNSEDDPDRLWCLCRKPHNNRFMICCDVCEEWFHGKCVGITKTIGKQMEQDGLEWSCPNCTKKKKLDENAKEIEKIKLLKEKMAQSIKEQQQKIRENQKLKNQSTGGKDKTIKLSRTENSDLRQTKIVECSQKQSNEDETVGRKCIMCKGPVRENSIYCSDDCIRKHSQHALSQTMNESNKKPKTELSGSSTQPDNIALVQNLKKEVSRIILMGSNNKKVLLGQQGNVPTKVIVTSPKVVKIQPKPSGEVSQKLIQLPSGQKVSVQQADVVKSNQLKLAVSPNSKQVKILQTSSSQGKKKVFQSVTNSSGATNTKPTTIIVRQKPPEVIDAVPIKTTPSKASVKAKSQETTSPKLGTIPKEAVNSKSEKMNKKRREKVSKASTATVTTTNATPKDPKQNQATQKSEDVKEKEKDKKDTDQQIRESVKKTLSEALKVRVQECKDMEFSDDYIDGLAVDIEEKLYKHFENKIDTKYKSKYRSLVFNIKDLKNETLFRKILDNSISPKELVKLSPEELASQELARWREKENQHQLEMIKKTELELMTIGNTYIMKSHKGEQVIESDQSEKVAAAAAEIDPNTPAQELVSALNSVSSTTRDVQEADEKKNKTDLETTLIKMKGKEREHRSSKDRDKKRTKRDRERRKSRSRSRSRTRRHRSKEKKRSRSRERDRDRSRHRHKEKKPEKKKEKDGKESSESPEEKPEQKCEKNEISTSEDLEEKTGQKQIIDIVDDADHEPSSTVTIKTPDINVEEQESHNYLWKGCIAMAEVAKFNGIVTEGSGDCSKLSCDIGERVDIVGRIPFDTVWDYIARMKKMATKDILLIKIKPSNEEEKASYNTLFSYLSKRYRIGVIGKTSESVKDFYIYPLASHSSIPPVLLPVDGFNFENEQENTLLGIIVRSKQKPHHQRSLSVESCSNILAKGTVKLSAVPEDESEKVVVIDRSYTPPLPEKEQDDAKINKKDPRLKKKIRVHVDFNRTPVYNDEDDDSPYSPGDSDEDLPPLPKLSKSSIPVVSTGVTKLLSPGTPNQEGNLQDPAEIQRKIDEMNRAIEEQTQQIQNLTSTVPKLAATVPLPSITLLNTVTSAILTPAANVSSNVTGPHSIPLPPMPPPVSSNKPAAQENVDLPLLSTENEERRGSPVRSFTPPLKIEESIPFLPEMTSKISLPSNLQEILNSIQKKSGSEANGEIAASSKIPKPVEDMIKSKTPDVNVALNVLNQTKNIFSGLSSISAPVKELEAAEKVEKSEDSSAILSRLSDEDIIQKAKEMEMEVQKQEGMKSSHVANPSALTDLYSSPVAAGVNAMPCPSQPLPPGVPDIPMMNPAGSFGYNLFPPPPLIPNVEPSSLQTLQSSKTKSGLDTEDRKANKKFKLDPKSVFESEGVPDFMSASTSWDDKKMAKTKNYKIDIKLGMNSLEQKNIDVDHFDIESISNIPELNYSEERKFHQIGVTHKTVEETKYNMEERILPGKTDSKHRGVIRNDIRRRRSEDWEGRRNWKYDRRHWDDGRRFKEDYRRRGGRRFGGPRFRKDRFEDKRDRHLEKEWEGSIKDFEERQRRRNQEIRREEIRRLRKRSGSSSN